MTTIPGSSEESGADRRSSPAFGAGFAVGLVFLVLAAWLLWGKDLAGLPKTEAVVVDPAALALAPRRERMTDPPTIRVGGLQLACMDCHLIFRRQSEVRAPLLQHSHIVLDHGINTRCLNCHHADDRDGLALHTGEAVPYEHVVRLCAKCHGPTYRDWQRGIHGRTNGYWDTSRGTQRRLQCTDCHDPHHPRSPAMDPIEPLPAPNTLRVGRPTTVETLAHGADTDPLSYDRHRAATGNHRGTTRPAIGDGAPGRQQEGH